MRLREVGFLFCFFSVTWGLASEFELQVHKLDNLVGRFNLEDNIVFTPSSVGNVKRGTALIFFGKTQTEGVILKIEYDKLQTKLTEKMLECIKKHKGSSCYQEENKAYKDFSKRNKFCRLESPNDSQGFELKARTVLEFSKGYKKDGIAYQKHVLAKGSDGKEKSLYFDCFNDQNIPEVAILNRAFNGYGMQGSFKNTSGGGRSGLSSSGGSTTSSASGAE